MATPAPATPAPRNAPPGGIDPEVKVPKAVRDAALRSQKLFEEQNAPPVDPNAPPAAAPPAANDTIIISDTPIDPPAAPPATPPAQPEPPAAPAASLPAGDTVSRADYLAMKGRFDKANANNVRLSEEVTNLRQLVTQLSAQPPAAAPPADPALNPTSLLTPQEIADYGPDFLDVVGKKAREIAGSEIAKLNAKIDELSRGVQATAQVTQQSAREQMFAKMDRDLPTWREQNSNEDFLAWLQLPDAYSGAIRGELLGAAYAQNNADRVLAFFKGFLTEEAATTPAIPTPPAAPAAQKVPLETFAAPGRAKSAAATPPAEKPIISRAQVSQFYLDVAAGKYRGREDEKNRLEAMIFSANAEGRLR